MRRRDYIRAKGGIGERERDKIERSTEGNYQRESRERDQEWASRVSSAREKPLPRAAFHPICASTPQERGFFSNTAKKINRHAIASLKSGQLAGLLVSSVNLALEDLAAVKREAIRSGLGLAPTVAASTQPMAFLDAEVRITLEPSQKRL